jgi:hypothetical protein
MLCLQICLRRSVDVVGLSLSGDVLVNRGKVCRSPHGCWGDCLQLRRALLTDLGAIGYLPAAEAIAQLSFCWNTSTNLNYLGSIPLVHFLFKALILRAQSARKISACSPFVRVGGGGGAEPTRTGGVHPPPPPPPPPPPTRTNGMLPTIFSIDAYAARYFNHFEFLILHFEFPPPPHSPQSPPDTISPTLSESAPASHSPHRPNQTAA